MSELTILQTTPAGHLALHWPLVASTPALLAWTASLAARLAPTGRWPIAIGGVAAAWLVLAIALLPDGASAAYQPGNTPISLHWGAVVAALACSLVSAWFARRQNPSTWGLWCGIGLLVPLIAGGVIERLYA